MSLWRRVFGTQPATNRDLGGVPVAQTGATTAYAYDAFVLGVNIEEFYIIFGEQVQAIVGGLPDSAYEAFERKAQMIRRTLVAFKVSDEVISKLTVLEGQVESGARGRPDSKTETAESMLASMMIGAQIGQLMMNVRQQLPDKEGLQYDLGIYAARISFCAKIILLAPRLFGAAGKEYVDLYTRELIRAGGELHKLARAAERNGALAAAFEPVQRERVLTIGSLLTGKSAMTTTQVQACEQLVEQLFAPLGLTSVLGRTPFN